MASSRQSLTIFCPRLRDFPDRKLTTLKPASAHKELAPLLGRRIRTEVIREHWDEILRLVASLHARLLNLGRARWAA